MPVFRRYRIYRQVCGKSPNLAALYVSFDDVSAGGVCLSVEKYFNIFS